VICGVCSKREAAACPDPRLPLLRIPSCWYCRDIIARAAGWVKGKRTTVWAKAFTAPVEVAR
jgi:hypothetical protein